MTPNEKAVEMTNKYLSIEDTQSKMGGNLMFKSEAKKCALIAIDEILEAIKRMVDEFSGYSADEYYIKVKYEIEGLPE